MTPDSAGLADPAGPEVLADRLFAALERGDVAVVADLWSDQITVWRQGGGPERDKARALKVIRWFVEATTARRYEILDRRFFDGGFVQQHIVHAVDRTGTDVAFRACLIVRVDDGGRIARIDEYLDPAELAPFSRT